MIPTLNQGPYIEDTLLSILWQGYDNVEIIVVDGGSTDDTPAVLERYRPWIRVLISRARPGPVGRHQQGLPPGQRVHPGLDQLRRLLPSGSLPHRAGVLRRPAERPLGDRQW